MSEYIVPFGLKGIFQNQSKNFIIRIITLQVTMPNILTIWNKNKFYPNQIGINLKIENPKGLFC